MMNSVSIYLLGFFVIYTEGSAFIEVPTVGNCGVDTVLTCQVTGNIGSTGWSDLGGSLVINGTPVRPEDNNKYTETRGTSSFTLTIHNTDLTDEGEYRCSNGFDDSQLKRLNIECKATAADLSVSSGKKVSITIDKLYPSSLSFSASFRKENTDITVQGSRTCSSSTQYSGYFRCIWSSSSSLADGLYTYSIVVTTITQADPLTGSFKIVSPTSPVILNTTKLDDNRVVLYENEGQSLTIQCTSTGGYPTPTVAWYKDSVSASNQLASKSSRTLQNDGTYTVTLSHTFTPTVTDDKKTLICRSYYPHADSAYMGSQTTIVTLYLRLKPSQPTVTQVTNVSSGGTVEVRCTTTGSRPAATITWSYQGSTFTGQDSIKTDNAKETYTVVSIFRRQVTSADNGREVQCVVTHPTLTSPSERTASVKLNVQFQASSTVITGNKVMAATGSDTLTLTCTTASSNPASDITWKNGSARLYSDRKYTNSTGENNGVVRSQQLVLKPTRYMDGDVVTCSVSNLLSQSPVTDTTTLNLRYRPLIEPMHDRVAVEGNKTVFSCSASSKPASVFTWYREGQRDVIYQGNGTLNSNQLAYIIHRVNRTNAGTYKCIANNGIETADEKRVSLIVHYPPVVSVVTQNTSVKAISVSLECSASGVPNAEYVYGQWIQTWPGRTGTLKQYPGSRNVELRNLTYEHSGVYTCSASNGIKVFGTDKEYMEGSVQLVVESYPIITKVPEIMSAKLNGNVSIQIDFYSNAAELSVKIYKNVNGSRENVSFTESEVPIQVDLRVFTSKIQTVGTRASISMKIASKDDFGFYDVVVSNKINSTFRTVKIISKDITVQSFYIEQHTDQDHVTFDEHDAQIDFRCVVNSNTASTTKIMFEGALLKEGVNVTSLSFTRHDISCYDAGVYTCEGTNDYGETSNKTLFLFVRCVPRPKGQIRRNLTSELLSSITLSFTAIAYPEPGSKGFAWQKEEIVGWVPLLSNDHLKISSSGLQSNLTVLNISNEDYGNYRVTVTNNIGNYVQHLFLSEETSAHKTDSQCKSQNSDQAALIVGISLGLVCCVLAGVATYLAISRMRTVTKEARWQSKTKTQSAYASTSFATEVVERQEYENSATGQGEPFSQSQYTDLYRYANTDKDTYDVIKKE